jgi:exonuclease SbcD
MVPSTVFDPALHYVALGHYHRCQPVPAGCPVWYCGSPLQLDFGDDETEKSVLWIEAAADTPAKIERIPLRSGRRLRTIRGSLAALEAAAAHAQDSFLRVEVTEAYRPGLADEVRALLPNAVDVRIAAAAAGTVEDRDAEPPFDQSPMDLFRDYLAERGEETEELKDLFRELLGLHAESEP